MPAPDVARWALARDPALRVRSWDDEAAGLGFDERSGDTFVLGPLAMELLALLDESGPSDAAALLDAIRASLPVEPPPTLAVDVRDELLDLQRRGLVAPLT